MSVTVYELPVTSTAFVRDASFEMLIGRVCALTYAYEASDGRVMVERIVFCGVESFMCTYYTANSLEVFEAYDRVVDLGDTEWLRTISKNLIRAGGSIDGLKHFRVYFDDGPCYEFISRSFEVTTATENEEA